MLPSLMTLTSYAKRRMRHRKRVVSLSARRQKRFMPEISACGEGKAASPEFLIKELSHSTRNCQFP
jgi:hypothetical protein